MKIHLALSENEPDISRLWALTYDMRIGPAVVKMGGIAGVGTKEEYRMRGYSRLVMEESTRYFTETGHDMAVLFGIPDFYHKFGYAPALAVTTLTINVQDALLTQTQKAQEIYTLRRLEEGDWPAVLDLYDENNRARTGTVLRPRNKWKGYPHGTSYECGTQVFVITGESEEIKGHIAFDDVKDACRIGDLGYSTPAVFPTLLRTMVEQAQQRDVQHFEVKLPPDHPFVIFCRRCGGEVKTVYPRNSTGMARIIGLTSLFEKLTGLLMERLQASPFTAIQSALELQTDLGNITLAIKEGRAAIENSAIPTWRAMIPQRRLAQLVMGYRSVSDIALDEDVDIPAEAIPLLEVLFPFGNPWMAMPDWF